MAKVRIPEKLKVWVEARRRHRLSHAHVQMARELGMNPKKLGKLDNHRQEPWKLPLPLFIEELYQKRFGRERPEMVLSIEQKAAKESGREAKRRERKQERRQERADVLAAWDVGPVTSLNGLGNGRTYRVVCGDGRSFILKKIGGGQR